MKSYVTGTASRGRTVVGSFTPSKFAQKNGKLAAVGKPTSSPAGRARTCTA